jgi:membrane protease YdiL (CAAX protease family)
VGPSFARIQPPWLWIPLILLQLAWMVAFPLWVASHRTGLPPLPRIRSVLIEASITFFVALFATVVSLAVVFLVTNYLVRGTSTNPFEGIAGSRERYHSVALVILAVAVAPFGEELLFRGVLYNFLRQRINFLVAALLSGVTFGFCHPFGLAERLAASTIGVLLALLYEWRKTIVSPILLHSMVNTIAMCMVFYSLAIAANAPVLGVRGDSRENGCLITVVVPGGAAEEAGVKVGDVITGAGENSVRSQNDLVLIMRMKKVGNRIPVWFTRDGQDYQVEAMLKARPK